MTLPQIYELTEYWERWPPVHRLLAAFLGIGAARAKRPAARESRGGIDGLLALAPNGLCRLESLMQHRER
jgi:hypothetical protein